MATIQVIARAFGLRLSQQAVGLRLCLCGELTYPVGAERAHSCPPPCQSYPRAVYKGCTPDAHRRYTGRALAHPVCIRCASLVHGAKLRGRASGNRATLSTYNLRACRSGHRPEEVFGIRGRADIPACRFGRLSSRPRKHQGTRKSPEPAGWKACPTEACICL
jgi:hypothetical protein